MKKEIIFCVVLSFKYISITVLDITLLRLGNAVVLLSPEKVFSLLVTNTKHPTAKLPYLYISFFGKDCSLGRSVFWEPKVLSTVLKVVDFTSSYKYDKDGIKFTYYKGTKTTTYEKAYDVKGNTVKN